MLMMKTTVMIMMTMMMIMMTILMMMKVTVMAIPQMHSSSAEASELSDRYPARRRQGAAERQPVHSPTLYTIVLVTMRR